MMAITGALEGLPRAGTARLAGMERQALRDAVTRYNPEGLTGLHDRPRQAGTHGWMRHAGRRSAYWCWTGRWWRPPD